MTVVDFSLFSILACQIGPRWLPVVLNDGRAVPNCVNISDLNESIPHLNRIRLLEVLYLVRIKQTTDHQHSSTVNTLFVNSLHRDLLSEMLCFHPF